jgi:Icc-related predicted phosphoesterase
VHREVRGGKRGARMKIIALSDLHGEVRALRDVATELVSADVVLMAGDVTHFGGAQAARGIVREVRQYNERLLAVPGNCDTPEAARVLNDEGISLDARHVAIDGVAFVGIGGSLPCPGHTPNEITEADFAARLAQAAEGIEPEAPLILLSHQPPFDTTADLAGGGQHVGSHAIRAFILGRRPLLCICGHIHEARGRDGLGGTVVLNPGPLRRGGYAYAEIDGVALRDSGVGMVP